MADVTPGSDTLAQLRQESSVSLPTALVQAARELDIDVSEACEAGLADAVARQRRRRQWQEENAAAIDAHNAWIEAEGPLLAEHRQF